MPFTTSTIVGLPIFGKVDNVSKFSFVVIFPPAWIGAMVDVRVRVSSGLGLCDAAGAISNAYRLILEGLFKVFEAREIFGIVEKAKKVRTSLALSRVIISL